MLARLSTSFPEKTPSQNRFSLEPFLIQIDQWVNQAVKMAAICQRLMERGYTRSYASVWRFLRTLKANHWTVLSGWIPNPAKKQAQIDFGYAGRIIDPETGKLFKAWTFVMILSWSRHQYVEFILDQKVMSPTIFFLEFNT